MQYMRLRLEVRTVFKLFNDTEIYIDEECHRIILTRGYWNFIQVSIDYSDSQDKDKIQQFFNEISEKGFIEEKK